MANLPAQMTAIGIPKPGGPEALVPEQRPVPQPRKGHRRQRTNRYPRR